jgi:hypothetical protein
VRNWTKKRDKLVDLANADMFSKDIGEYVLDPVKQAKAEKKLLKLRQTLIRSDPVIHTGPFLEKMKILQNSPIYECLDRMPKPVVHHLHDCASVSVKWMI